MQKTSTAKDWKPVNDYDLPDAWEQVKEIAEAIQEDLRCPEEEIAKILRSVADTFDNSVEDALDKEEESWEEN